MARISIGGPRSQPPAGGADSSGRLLRLGPTLANVVLIALAAWLATAWFWYFWPQDGAPQSGSGAAIARPLPSAAALGETVANAQLFGVGARTELATAEAVSTLNLKLKGVFASSGSRLSVAILNNGQRDEFVNTGGEVMPGVVLDQVFATHVVIRRGGQLERVNLEERVAGGGALARPGPPNLPRSAPMFVPNGRPITNLPPPSLPPGIAGDKSPPPQPNIPPPSMLPPGVPGVPPPQSGGPQAAQDLGRFEVSASGLAIAAVPHDGLLARAGLQPGDVVKSVNGQPVTSAADIARLAQLAATGQTIRGEILRDGKTVPIRIRATQ